VQTSTIYQPVQEDLLQVEECLRQVGEVAQPYLAGPLKHILARSGKRLRPALCLLVGKCYDYNLEVLVPVATGVELLHTATLVHDDSVDNALVRRGVPTINSLWGSGVAVLVGDYLFAKAASLVSAVKIPRVMSLFAQTLMAISSGELAQNFAAFNVSISRHQYFERIGQKTASLFALATEAGAVVSQAPEADIKAFRDYGYSLGLAFQIIDDILDYTGQETELGKPTGNDLSQGTITLPAIIFGESHPQPNPVTAFVEHRDDQAYLERAVAAVCHPAIIEKCYAIAGSFCSQACAALPPIPAPVRHSLVELCHLVLKRQK